MFFSEGYGKPYKHTIREIRHDYLPNFSEESLFEGTDRTFSKVYVELPYPIHKPYKTSDDLVQKLLKDKSKYNDLQESIRKRYLMYDKSKIKKKKRDGRSYSYLPQYLINWYEEKDPDPTFNSDYNYYYTNGNLELFQDNNNDYLMCPDLDNNLCITNVLSDADITTDVVKINHDSNSTIFSINSTPTNNGLYFVLREKHRTSVVKLKEHFKVRLKYSKEHQQPVLDAKLSTDCKLGLIFPNTKFSIKDIKTDSTVISFKSDLSKEVDSLQQFRFLDENTVMIMDRTKIKIIDIRDKTEEMCFEPKLLKCNGLYNFSTLGNTCLIASRHYILKTDLRFFDEVLHYSHSLSEAPCYLDYTKRDADTYLTVSGQHYDSKVLFTGQSPFSLPYKIPSLKRTLIETRLKYPSLVMEHNLDTRPFYSLTGLKVVNSDGVINIFTSNCFGEIFKQKVFETEPSKSDPIEKFYAWSQHLEKPDIPLYLTHFEEISDIRFSLNEPYLQKNLKQYKAKSKEKEFLRVFNGKFSSGKVKSLLAKDFLSVWENSDEEKEVDELPQEEAHEKVNNWIQTHNFKEEDEK